MNNRNEDIKFLQHLRCTAEDRPYALKTTKYHFRRSFSIFAEMLQYYPENIWCCFAWILLDLY